MTSIPSVTRLMHSRASSALRGGGGEENMIAISLPRVAILERPLDTDERPTWRGRPKSAEERYATRSAIATSAKSRLAEMITIKAALNDMAARLESVEQAMPPPTPSCVPQEALAPLRSPPTETLDDLLSGQGVSLRKWRYVTALRAVSHASKVPVADIVSLSRLPAIVRPRMIVLWILYRYGRCSYPAAGRLMKRDHSTVMHNVQRVEEIIAQGGVLIDATMTVVDAATAILTAWGHFGAPGSASAA